MINEVRLSGGLTADPEVNSFGDSGGQVANFNIGFDTGNYKQPHGYIRCTAWNDTAAEVAQLRKASQVTLKGTLGFDQWTDKKDGSKRSQNTLTVTEVS